MSTQFFERQEVQRSYTRWLVLGFITAILLVVAAINLIVLVGVGGNPLRVLRHNPEYVFWVSLIVLGTILIATWHKASQLRAGGAVVARQLGGIQINSNDPDFARKRLVNVVEEMAIAARIRRPQVFLLPEEPGINAFAAGNSPDEAAVAVTQGALDKLDRDQLQAVIGHEFSHILNGDMRLNMRLTAWIFGLFVITDLALRIMRGRSRGKSDGRIRLIAVGIFVAGSIGLLAGRLLQAAVSRRREHLADASSVQFTRNPQALQGAFIAMAANAEGSQLQNAGSVNMAHMLFAGSEPVWATKLGGSWFSTHPSLEERVRGLDPRVSEIKFRLMVSDYRRKSSAQDAAAASAAEAEAAAPSAAAPPVTVAATAESYAALSLPTAEIAALPDFAAPVMAAAAAAPAAPVIAAAAAAPIVPPKAAEAPASNVTMSGMALAETLPSGVRLIAGRALPPDVLRNRLSTEQQAAILATLAHVEQSLVAVQALYVATMLDSNPAKWRTQLTRLAPLLGIELFKETQAQIARVAALAPAARLPTLVDLLSMLDKLEPADRKRLRALARAFAPTVATGDMLRFSVTRILEKRLAKAKQEPLPVPLPERAPAICEFYAALAQCRFGAGKQGQNSYRAGVMGMLPPKTWASYPEALITPAALDATLAALNEIHPTGKRSLSEGMARVIAVGGRLTVSQVDLLRGACLLIDCPVPVLPIDVVYEDSEAAPPEIQASAR